MVFAPAPVPSFQVPTAATPAAFVVALVPVADPPPEATAKVTATPGTGLPKESVTSTDGAVATFAFTVAPWLSPPSTPIAFAAAAVPVALNVTELSPVADAVSVFAPAVVPSCQLPTVAMPPGFVVAPAPVAEPPPPEAPVKATAIPETGLPNESVTRTDGALATFVWTVAL